MKLYKKIGWFFLASIFCVLNFNCSDEFLESVPENDLSAATFYKTISDYEKAINGSYRTLALQNNEFTYFPMMDCATPFAGAGKTRFGVYDNGNVTANSVWRITKAYWSTYYRTINRANEVLRNLDAAPEGTDQASLDRIKGEALFLRAFCYFYLSNYYGAVPLITDIQNIDEVQVERSPKSEVVEQVILDLTEAVSLLPSVTSYRGGSLMGRASKGSAQGYLGKVLVFEERYDEAKGVLKDLIESGDYELTQGPTGFIDNFWPEGDNNNEAIFEIQYNEVEGNRMNRFCAAPAVSGMHSAGFNYINPRENYLDLFETVNGGKVSSTFVSRVSGNPFDYETFNYSSDDPAFDPLNPYEGRDPRLKWTAWYEGTPYIQEFEQRTGQTGVNYQPSYSEETNHNTVKMIVGNAFDVTGKDASQNYKTLRYADILLLYAEVLLEGESDIVGAAQYINMIRSRESVNMPNVPIGTEAEMRTSLREERFRELAFEYGHVYMDMRRWGIYADEMEKFWTVNKNGRGNPALTTFDQNYLIWPLPQEELDTNPALSQNPGY